MKLPDAAKCSLCLAGDLKTACEESFCPFWSASVKQAGICRRQETRGVGETIHEISEWEAERLRQEQDALYAIVWSGVLLGMALFAALFWAVGGVWWGGD